MLNGFVIQCNDFKVDATKSESRLIRKVQWKSASEDRDSAPFKMGCMSFTAPASRLP